MTVNDEVYSHSVCVNRKRFFKSLFRFFFFSVNLLVMTLNLPHEFRYYDSAKTHDVAHDSVELLSARYNDVMYGQSQGQFFLKSETLRFVFSDVHFSCYLSSCHFLTSFVMQLFLI